MTRQNRSPSGGSTIVNTLRPYEGGTGQTTAIAALTALDVVPLSTVNQPNGVAGLGSDGKLPTSTLPIDQMSVVSVEGATSLVKSAITTYKINNFDMFSTYDVQAVGGASLSRSADTITFTAPNAPGSSGFTINGRMISVTIVDIKPNTPTLAAIDVAGGAGAGAAQGTGSVFSMNSGAATHASSDWQVASDSAFNTIVSQSLNDATNKTTWKSGDLSLSTTYYVRVRYRDSNTGVSDWSNVVSITTKTTYGVSVEEAKLISSTPVSGAQGAIIVKITNDGLRVVYGAWRDTGPTTNTGAAYVFVRSGTTWSQEAKIFPSDASTVFARNCDVTSDGSRIIFSSSSSTVSGTSAAGAAYVYSRSGSTWALEQKIISTTPIANGSFGNSVSISADGTRIAVGAPAETATGTANAGTVSVYLRTGTTWAQEQKMIASDKVANSSFGITVEMSADGTRIAVGATAMTTTVSASAGAVYIYLRTGTTWAQEAKIFASNGTSGASFGGAVAATSDFTRLAIGAYATTNGTLYSFLRTGTSWAQEALMVATDGASGDGLGTGVAITDDGATIYGGAWAATVSAKTLNGAMYSFTRSGSTWTQKSKFAQSDTLSGVRYGTDCCVTGDGTRLVVGAINASAGATTTAGAAYVVR